MPARGNQDIFANFTSTTSKPEPIASISPANMSVGTRYGPNPTDIFMVFTPHFLLLDRYCTVAWYVVGILSNLVNILVWSQPKMRRENSSAVYLAVLSITDLCYLLLHIVQELQYIWNINTLSFPVICESFFVFAYTAGYMSPLLVLAFGVERYLAIRMPFRRDQLCTPFRAFLVSMALILFTFGLNCFQAYLWIYDSKAKSCKARPEATKPYHDNLPWSLWFSYSLTLEMIMTGIVPLAALLFNLLVIFEMKKIARKTRQCMPATLSTSGGAAAAAAAIGNHSGNHTANLKFKTTTVMLLLVSFYLIFSTLPAGLMFALQPLAPQGNENLSDKEIRADYQWQKYFVFICIKRVIDEICMSHFALNFIIYLATGQHYRKQLLVLLGRSRSTSSPSYAYAPVTSMTKVNSRNSRNDAVKKSFEVTDHVRLPLQSSAPNGTNANVTMSYV